MNVKRYISVFDGRSDALVAELPIDRGQFYILRQKLGLASDNPGYDSYPLPREWLEDIGLSDAPYGLHAEFFLDASAV